MLRNLRWTNIFWGLFVLLILFGHWLATFYIDYLWFVTLGFRQVFLTIFLSEIGLKVAVVLLFLVAVYVNLLFTRRYLREAAERAIYFHDDNVITLYQPSYQQVLTSRSINTLLFLAALLTAVVAGLAVSGDWVVVQKYLKASSFNIADPIFNRDVGYYVFKMPFYLFIYRLALFLLVACVFWVVIAYAVAEMLRGNRGRFSRAPQAVRHLSVLAAVFFILKAAGYYLNQYLLLYSPQGVVYGPGYTDIHATLVGYRVLILLVTGLAILMLANVVFKNWRYFILAGGAWLFAALILTVLYPAFVQKFIVEPNELNREKPYIKNNIVFTRLAYDLDNIERKSFPAGRVLSAAEIKNNEDIIQNIRLWDYRPLQSTYSQVQEMRTYYELKNIDIDRYNLNGRYRQVMLAARELNIEQLPPQAKTWINQRLKYTHGYGVVMSAVNEVTPEGLPSFLVKDIPPAASVDLKIERPEIYFGELTHNYVIVNTKSPEFDYPQGEDNAYTTYKADSGVKINSLWRRFIFAIAFTDYRLLLSSEITNDSQVLYYRDIKTRVKKIAPFLLYDNDPYLVVSGGKLYWLWDAYTTTSMFPYSEPFDENRNNYIRNAVKVVVDAYTGQVTFYAADTQDPLLKTYSRIFPGLFQSLTQMLPDLRQHLRYPEDIFLIQARKYAVYHMLDPEVFYNKEDKWNLPTEIFADKEQPMEPYYTILRLPGEKELEFIQIMPFTPQNKKNMIAWLAGRSDGANYGRLLVYEFPKQELVYGPMQIEARINQDAVISQQITLWDQKGSRVIRGNMMVVPIEDALLYVEPLYLQSEQSKMPELRRVIVAHGERIVMEPTLDQAIRKLFAAPIEPPRPPGTPPALEKEGAATTDELIREANKLYHTALERLKEGDWTGYGEAIKKLGDVLKQMQDKTGKE